MNSGSSRIVTGTRACRDGCGRLFELNRYNGKQVWHPECPGKHDARLQAFRARTNNKQRGARRECIADRVSVKVCWACANLPERRPLSGCPPRSYSRKGRLLTCGLPHGDAR